MKLSIKFNVASGVFMGVVLGVSNPPPPKKKLKTKILNILEI